MLQPKISVIIPIYNVEKYISKCIESILIQSYNNLEIIIVNDGSTDKSGDVCAQYAKNDDRIVLIHQDHQGVSVARNNALDIASGEYIGFVDSDDWIEPDMFETLYNNAAIYNADISMCNFYYVRTNGDIVPYSNEKEDIKLLEGVYKITHNIRLSNNVLWNRLYKCELFNDNRFPKGKIFEDIFVMYKLVDTANKIVLSAECKYYYLRRDTGITLSLFTIEQMDIVEAYIERHNYISSRYPNLEKTSRKFIFTSLLWGMRKAYTDKRIELYRESLCKIIDKVKFYDFTDCILSSEEKNLLKLLSTDIDLYIIEMGRSIQLR